MEDDTLIVDLAVTGAGLAWNVRYIGDYLGNVWERMPDGTLEQVQWPTVDQEEECFEQ